ncbi:rCG55716 [Rattus norvegicus]|uniref:RCG55716 n=1 Tax=Rattus norvegicus TaxID=10116 RepID=A6JLY6_RAT|nr:rCG55716 [Rattus norvegicus]
MLAWCVLSGLEPRFKQQHRAPGLKFATV